MFRLKDRPVIWQFRNRWFEILIVCDMLETVRITSMIVFLRPPDYLITIVQDGNLVSWEVIERLKPGPRLNIKTVLSTYGDFHVKDKTAVRTSYL